ncbi:hypothetical protein BP6252_13413 [Coleophoma cylindrospora]|uniref:Vacuolar segregation protein 7 n=1 Tax=Coleophoma cylindrospora TaxID=1849047 RepID=A0A3D8Q848_9HELO|nr:hypothetical protein BP6252_13413 [Coleophoma cylindrospora]
MDDTSLASSGATKLPSKKSADSVASTSEDPASMKPAPSSTPSLTATKKTQPQQKRGPSASNSPLPSREPSPVRPSLKGSVSARSSNPSRSRKNSHDTSPSRSSSTTNPPSLAATQRALSAASIPNLHPITSDPAIKAPIPLKPSVNSDFKDAPRWPVSPRLRSPPPTNKSSVLSPRKTEQELPVVNVQRSLQNSPEQIDTKVIDIEADDSLGTGMKTPARGVSGGSSTLETVQEISQPGTPALSLDGAVAKREDGSTKPSNDQDNMMEQAFGKAFKTKSNGANESGSDSGGRSDIKMRVASAAPATTTRAAPPTKSFSSNSVTAAPSRSKPTGDGSQMMTVETETVSSIPAVALGTGVGGVGMNGSLRAKPSSETIRPKREKKKAPRKAPSVTSGTGEQLHLTRPKKHHHHAARSPSKSDSDDSSATLRFPTKRKGQGPCELGALSDVTRPTRQVSFRRLSITNSGGNVILTRTRLASSKADIFEAKVASAVDEANSSDSEETFVYESNPPDTNDRPRRFHSRTPSATSMASQVDQRNGLRSMLDGGHSVAMKKSMKFANSYNSNGQDVATGEDDGRGTGRSNMGTGRGTAHHHHIGRWGRNGGNGHASLFDNESPFPNAAKSKLGSPRNGSRPTSPKVANNTRLMSQKKQSPISSGYDLEADDERTPLIQTIRSGRSGRTRRPVSSSMRQLEHQAARQHRSFLTRFAGCLVLTLMIVLVISGAVGFMFATTQPLTDVKVLTLKNVLASEQELIFDMQVVAHNPNLVVVTVDSMDMLVFAKSKHAGTDAEWREYPMAELRRRRGIQRRDDSPADPPLDDDPNTNPNLEIGHIYEFESPLTFDGSAFHHTTSTSLGELRVYKPGNRTVPGGSKRWGKVVQHEFDLIIRGSLKYTLPLSQRVRSVTVEGRVTVKPNAADQDPDSVHIIV